VKLILRFIGRARQEDGAEAAAERAAEAAFGTALQAQLPRLRRYAIALAGNTALADDLVQDAAERALSRRSTLADKELLYPWLRSILHNLHIDELRRRRSRGTPVDIADVADTIALSAPSADRSATRDFVRAMNQLSIEHRQILLLSGVEGLSYKEIAAELSIPIGTVMSRLARAREQLRLRLDPPGPAGTVTAFPGPRP
jgi:RNA polymerase sigma-70 factor (ECF subfamily)